MASIDVVVPSYQYGRYLRECLISVLTQGVDGLRVLVIDNASTDNSVEVAQDVALHDCRVEVIARKTNLGATMSWNEGIDWASGDYFMVLCADDFLLPDCLPPVLAFLDGHPEVSFVAGRDCYSSRWDSPPPGSAAIPNDSWSIYAGGDFIRRQCRYPAVTAAPIVRTAMQKRAGYYRAELPFTDDLEMQLRLACLGSVAETPAGIVVQRLHQTNLSNALWSDAHRRFCEGEATFASFFASKGATLPDAARLQRLASRSHGKHAYWTAVSHFCRGDFDSSRELIRFAISRCPSTVLVPPIDYLFSMERPAERIRNAMASVFAGGARE